MYTMRTSLNTSRVCLSFGLRSPTALAKPLRSRAFQNSTTRAKEDLDWIEEVSRKKGAKPFSRTFDKTVESAKKQYLNALKRDLGSDQFADTKLPTKLVLDSLKNMQAYRSWTPSGDDHAATFKDAHRSAAQLTIEDPKEITLGQLEGVISPEAGVVWRMFHHLVQSGQPNELADLDEEHKAMVLFSRVHSIGKKYAETFAANGARNLDQLYESTDKEYGRKVSQAQKLAILHFNDMEKLIAREEVERIQAEFGRILKKKVDSKFQFEVMGSYRRGAVFSSDVDIVVYHPSYDAKAKDVESSKDEAAKELMQRLREELLEAGFLQEDKIFSSGIRKIIGLTRTPVTATGERPWRQVDIRLCPLNAVPYMLVGNTGDTHLMKMLRSRAIEKGLSLNEYGMGKQKKSVDGKRTSAFIEGTEVAAQSEKDIFEYLNLPYLQPKDRSFSRYKDIAAYSRRIARTQTVD